MKPRKAFVFVLLFCFIFAGLTFASATEEAEMEAAASLREYEFAATGELTIVFDLYAPLSELFIFGSVYALDEDEGWVYMDDFFWDIDTPFNALMEVSCPDAGTLAITFHDPLGDLYASTDLILQATGFDSRYITIEPRNGLVYDPYGDDDDGGEGDAPNWCARLRFDQCAITGPGAATLVFDLHAPPEELWIWRSDDDGITWRPYWNPGGDFEGPETVEVSCTEEGVLTVRLFDACNEQDEAVGATLFALEVPGMDTYPVAIIWMYEYIDDLIGSGGDRTGVDRFSFLRPSGDNAITPIITSTTTITTTGTTTAITTTNTTTTSTATSTTIAGKTISKPTMKSIARSKTATSTSQPTTASSGEIPAARNNQQAITAQATKTQNGTEPQTEPSTLAPAAFEARPAAANPGSQPDDGNVKAQPELPRPPVKTNTALWVTGIAAAVLLAVLIVIYRLRRRNNA